jgi:hypothetical protein
MLPPAEVEENSLSLRVFRQAEGSYIPSILPEKFVCQSPAEKCIDPLGIYASFIYQRSGVEWSWFYGQHIQVKKPS